jgi:hypothetical protein
MSKSERPEQAGDATQDCSVDTPAQANRAPVIGPTGPSDSNSAGPIGAPRPQTYRQPRDHRRRAAQEALRSLYPAGFPLGELADTRLGKVNDWLKASGRAIISKATLGRAGTN